MGGVLGVLVLCGLLLLLSRGHPKAQPQLKGPPGPVASGASAGVKDALSFAKDLESRLRAEPRYARVYLVHSAATANQNAGKVMVMGEVESEEDLRALQGMAAQGGIPIMLDWQVAVQRPSTAAPVK